MTTTVTSVNSETSPQLIIAADGSRTSLTIQNTDDNELFLGPTSSVSTTNYTYRRVYGTGYTFDGVDARQAFYGVWDGDGSGGATITAITDPVSDSNGAFSTYSALKDEIAAWLRPNMTPTADMTARIPVYVGLAEVMIRRELHLRRLDQTVTALAITDGVATVPTGFQSVVSLTLDGEPYNQITALPVDQVRAMARANNNTKPRHYAVSGGVFYFDFEGDATAELISRRGVTPLSADNDTNWILSGHPDVYLSASLVCADRRLIGPRLGEWKQWFSESLDSIKRLEMNLHSDIIRPMPNGVVA